MVDAIGRQLAPTAPCEFGMTLPYRWHLEPQVQDRRHMLRLDLWHDMSGFLSPG